MTDLEIQELVSKEILKGIGDAGLETVIRRCLFNSENKIDWQELMRDIENQMPEYKVVEEEEIVEGKSKAIINLGNYLDGVYNKNKRWTCGEIEPTMSDVTELYDVYQNLVHNGVAANQVTTISQKVHDCLVELGFELKEKGVGWYIAKV